MYTVVLLKHILKNIFPATIFLFKVKAFTCAKLTILTLEQPCRSGVFINFEQILHIVLEFQLLTLNKQMSYGLLFID